MTLKPTTGLAAETESTNDLEDLSDELSVDASDDVTVEAAEDVTTESSTRAHEDAEPTPAPIPSFMTSIADPGPTPPPSSLLDVLGPSLPLPGVTTAPSLDESLAEPPVDDDVTTLARGGDDDITVARPAVTDDDEEETKVEPAETAIHAAAIRDDVGAALSEQASFEREKALRKSSPGLFGTPGPGDSVSGVEFADPETNDDDEVISAGPVVDEDDDGIVVGGHTRDQHPGNGEGEDDSTSMFAKSADPSPLVAALTARRPGSPPTGSPFRADGFGSARLPTPSPGFAGLSLASPAPVPAPASSPFGKLASVPAPYGSGTRTTTSSHPALQIPAPSGAAATPSEGTGFLRKVQIPLGFLVTAGLSCAGVGVIVGWLAHGGTPPAPPVPLATAPRAAVAAPLPPPVVQPVAAPEPAAAPSALPPATGAPATPEPVAAKSTSAPAAQAEALDESGQATRAAVKHTPPKPRKPTLDVGDEAPATAPRQAATPKPAPAPKPAKPAGKTGGKKWVDPFAD